MDTIEIDELGFVWIDKLKVCRLTMWRTIEFYDRDKRRSARRGSCFVYVSIEQMKALIESYERMVSG